MKHYITTWRRVALTALAAIAMTVMMQSCKAHLQWADADVAQFEALISQPGVQLLDVRTPQEFLEGHIAGAKNVDLLAGEGDFAVRAGAVLRKKQPVAVYCRSGKRSARAAEQLSKAGFKVTNLQGGIISWQVAGKQVQK